MKIKNLGYGHWAYKGFDVYYANHPQLYGRHEIFNGDKFISRACNLKETKDIINRTIKSKTLIRKEILVEVKVGDVIKAPNTIFRNDLTLYVCHVEGDLIYISDKINTPKHECEVSLVQDCYLV
jgi:hypothetical protein